MKIQNINSTNLTQRFIFNIFLVFYINNYKPLLYNELQAAILSFSLGLPDFFAVFLLISLYTLDRLF